jgi:hypothetical protein
MQATACCVMFYGALDDFMLKLLMVCSIVSITVEFIMVDGEKHPQEYYYCKLTLPTVTLPAITLLTLLSEVAACPGGLECLKINYNFCRLDRWVCNYGCGIGRVWRWVNRRLPQGN